MPQIPPPYSEDEVRELFLKHVWQMIHYWNNQQPDRLSALEGLAFTILSTLDGSAMDLPGFLVIPSPHPDDKEDCIAAGDRWFPPYSPGDTTVCDIGGVLHEQFYKHKP